MHVETKNLVRSVYRCIDPNGSLKSFVQRRRLHSQYKELHVLSVEEGYEKLSKCIASGTPFAAAKIGSSEARSAAHVLNFHSAPNEAKAIQEAFVGPGVYPTNRRALEDFVSRYQTALSGIDFLGIWQHQFEVPLINTLTTKPELYESRFLEPFYAADGSWLRFLADKRVIVVSPFADSILSQVPRLADVWPDRDIRLGAIQVLKFPHSPATTGEPTHPSWSSLVEAFKQRISELEFDVLLAGCGAAGVPLAVEAKRLGKAGIVMGGGLQLLFGITGRRWQQRKDFDAIVNDYWIRPLPSETPPMASRVENACYW